MGKLMSECNYGTDEVQVKWTLAIVHVNVVWSVTKLTS